MQNWAEIRTAFHLAELKTISATAETLGLHRATVVRHIQALEQEIGAKVFHRHSRGYEPTEIGHDLLNVARATQDQFNQLAARARNASGDLCGDFIVTSHEHVAGLLMPALTQFKSENPGLHVQYIASAEVLKLEYGAAHIALRSGPKPSDPDNVVRPFMDLNFGMYAHPHYLDAYGYPDADVDERFGDHRFVRWDTRGMGMPFSHWFQENVPDASIVLSSVDLSVTEKAVASAMGIGLIAELDKSPGYGLIRVLPSLEDWKVPLWLVTHVDLHRSTKVQAFLDVVKRTEPR